MMEEKQFQKEKDTNHLVNDIKKAEDFQKVHTANQDFYTAIDITEALNDLLAVKLVKKAQVIRQAGLPEVSGYQYFDGRRKPTRDKVLALAFGFELDLEETNMLLKQTNYAQLYAKNERDAVIIFGLSHGQKIYEVEELLYQSSLATLLNDN